MVILGLMMLSACLLVASGCSSGQAVTLGTNYTDTITSSDPSEGEDYEDYSTRWWYHVYTLDVEEGHPYEFTLTTHNDVTTGIWSEDKGGWIVEVNISRPTRTAIYRFEHGGKQTLWVEAAEVPAEYSWHVTR
jgi:hypothetical protein